MNTNMTKGRKFLSDLKLYSDYLGWNGLEKRYETWEEACEDVFENTHAKKYSYCLPALRPWLDKAKQGYKEMNYLASQRNLQFRGEDIFKHEFKMFNCVTSILDKPSFFGNAFYILLAGCGLDTNMMLPFVKRLPQLAPRTKGTKDFVIQDTIEGWADAAHVLVTSYLYNDSVIGYEEYNGHRIIFDYSKIRPKGARLGRRFKAPGSEGIKKSFECIEQLLNRYLADGDSKEFKSIIAYDIFMFLAEAVLSGGVRRAACSVIVSPEDNDMVFAKVGDWFSTNPQRGRSNNAVGLIKHQFTREEFEYYLNLNKGMADIGFILLNHIYEASNPCREIGFVPLFFNFEDKSIVDRIKVSDISLLEEGKVLTCFNNCNLVDINGRKMKTEKAFYETCEQAAITGTLQAGYTNFKHLTADVLEASIALCQREALLGVGINGFMNSPKILLNPEVLRKGAEIVKETNRKVAAILGIRPAARTTTSKPGGNSGVILGTASGCKTEHDYQYFRVMQLNKQTDTATYLKEHMPALLEEGVYSANKSDYAVFIPIENDADTITNRDVKGVKHLEIIKLIKENWIDAGKNTELCTVDTTEHSVSNTVTIDDPKAIADFIFENQDALRAVSFVSDNTDKDFNQAPNTSVLKLEEIVEKYGDGSLLASGLIVDGLHAFGNNLWLACDALKNTNTELTGDRYIVFEKKEWLRRAKKFSKNYFKGDLDKTIYCLKDVHLYHKWKVINRELKDLDFSKILNEPVYKNIQEFAAMACSADGLSCEIVRI
jgi:ribonucleoside-triphosphate reductase